MITTPLLLNALQLAWITLLQSEVINGRNIETAPLKVVASVLHAASEGETNPHILAEVAVSEWNSDGAPTLN